MAVASLRLPRISHEFHATDARMISRSLLNEGLHTCRASKLAFSMLLQRIFRFVKKGELSFELITVTNYGTVVYATDVI